MMKQNTFEFQGRIFVAVEDTRLCGCDYCDLKGKGVCHVVPCMRGERDDEREVHWELSNGHTV